MDNDRTAILEAALVEMEKGKLKETIGRCNAELANIQIQTLIFQDQFPRVKAELQAATQRLADLEKGVAHGPSGN